MTTFTTWRDGVVNKLRSRPRGLTLDQIAADTGLSVGWLKDLAGNKGSKLNPGINSMEQLDAYLSERTDHV